MKIGVFYYSEKGNTLKIAGALAEAGGGKAELAAITRVSAQTVAGYDLILLGMPVHGDAMPDAVKEALHKIPLAGKRIALFYNHAAPMDHACPRNFLASAQKYLKEKGALLVASWHCRGENKNLEVLAWLKENDPAVYELALTAKGKPDLDDLAGARQWLKEILNDRAFKSEKE